MARFIAFTIIHATLAGLAALWFGLTLAYTNCAHGRERDQREQQEQRQRQGGGGGGTKVRAPQQQPQADPTSGTVSPKNSQNPPPASQQQHHAHASQRPQQQQPPQPPPPPRAQQPKERSFESFAEWGRRITFVEAVGATVYMSDQRGISGWMTPVVIGSAINTFILGLLIVVCAEWGVVTLRARFRQINSQMPRATVFAVRALPAIYFFVSVPARLFAEGVMTVSGDVDGREPYTFDLAQVRVSILVYRVSYGIVLGGAAVMVGVAWVQLYTTLRAFVQRLDRGPSGARMDVSHIRTALCRLAVIALPITGVLTFTAYVALRTSIRAMSHDSDDAARHDFWEAYMAVPDTINDGGLLFSLVHHGYHLLIAMYTFPFPTARTALAFVCGGSCGCRCIRATAASDAVTHMNDGPSKHHATNPPKPAAVALAVRVVSPRASALGASSPLSPLASPNARSHNGLGKTAAKYQAPALPTADTRLAIRTNAWTSDGGGGTSTDGATTPGGDFGIGGGGGGQSGDAVLDVLLPPAPAAAAGTGAGAPLSPSSGHHTRGGDALTGPSHGLATAASSD